MTIVGQVISVQKQATNHVFTIDDGTGSIEARRWIASSDEDGTKSDGIECVQFLRSLNYADRDPRELQYVRVSGGLKSFGKKRYVNINSIRRIKDPHETYFHILETIAVSLIVERGPVSFTPDIFDRVI